MIPTPNLCIQHPTLNDPDLNANLADLAALDPLFYSDLILQVRNELDLSLQGRAVHWCGDQGCEYSAASRCNDRNYRRPP